MFTYLTWDKVKSFSENHSELIHAWVVLNAQFLFETKMQNISVQVDACISRDLKNLWYKQAIFL